MEITRANGSISTVQGRATNAVAPQQASTNTLAANPTAPNRQLAPDLNHAYSANLGVEGQPQTPIVPEEYAPAFDGSGSATLKYSRTEQVGLFIKTQEGDSVRLKFGTREKFKIEASQEQHDGIASSELTLTSKTNSKLSLKIKGDLNAEELAAIQDTFDKASALASEFFAGNLQAAFDSASSLNYDAEQLSRVSFRASVRQRLTYSVKGFGSDPQVPTAPDSAPQIDAPVEGAPGEVGILDSSAPEAPTAPAPAPAPSGDAAGVEADAPVESGDTEAPGDSIEAPESTPPSEEPSGEGSGDAAAFDPARIIGEFLSRLSDALGGDSGTQNSVLDFSLKVRVFKSTLVTLSEQHGPEEGGLPELVPETLDAVAEQNVGPFNEVA